MAELRFVASIWPSRRAASPGGGLRSLYNTTMSAETARANAAGAALPDRRTGRSATSRNRKTVALEGTGPALPSPRGDTISEVEKRRQLTSLAHLDAATLVARRTARLEL
jgi:hypothetical protein